MPVKAKIEMDLDQLLRVAVMLDHHCTTCAHNWMGEDKDSALYRRWSEEQRESHVLREALLKAVTNPNTVS